MSRFFPRHHTIFIGIQLCIRRVMVVQFSQLPTLRHLGLTIYGHIHGRICTTIGYGIARLMFPPMTGRFTNRIVTI